MARYIDVDKMIDGYSTTFPYDLSYCDDGDLMEWLEAQPTADVVPKTEVARGIFEEIEKTIARVYNDFMFNKEGVGMNVLKVIEFSDDLDLAIAELKKKYTKGN